MSISSDFMLTDPHVRRRDGQTDRRR